MTKEETFEMFDRYGAYETLNTGETVQVIHWRDLKHIAEEIVKNCSIPDVIERFTIDDAKEMVNAWESLPEGHYDSQTICEWLTDAMKPVIDKFRAKIKNAL